MQTPTDYSSVQESSLKPINNLYELLESNLKALYAARDRNATLEDRWRFRGSYLLLNLAAQACPSNPIYDLFRLQKPDEGALLLSILQFQVSRLKPTKSPPQPLSSPLAIIYSKLNHEHTRYDSAFSTVPCDITKSVSPMISELWYAIFEGSTDPSKTIAAATAVVEAACPDMDAVGITEKMGDPCWQFTQEDELRIGLRKRLFPGYNDLIKSSAYSDVTG